MPLLAWTATLPVNWTPITIGGGGYITGTLVHPTTGNTWFRTDIGGVYFFDQGSLSF